MEHHGKNPDGPFLAFFRFVGATMDGRLRAWSVFPHPGMDVFSKNSMRGHEISMRKARILIADKHQVVIQGLKNALQGQGHAVIGEASTTDQAVELAKLLSPDILITDFPLADHGNKPFLASIHKASPRARIVIFTSRSNVHFSSGYWHRNVWATALKEQPLTDLLYAVEEVSCGRTCFRPSRDADQNARSSHGSMLTKATGDSLLGSRETQVFLLLADGQSISEIASQLGVSPKTVETQKSRIMKKLNARNILDLTRIALRNGVIEL